MKKDKLTFLKRRKKMLLMAALAMASFNFSFGQTLISEDFTGQTLPAGWDTISVTDDGTWAFDNPGSRSISNGPGANFDNDFAIFDSDHHCGSNEDAELVTPAFNANVSGTLILSFDNSFHDFGSQEGHVEVWNGSSWTDVLTMSGANDGYANANHKVIDITAAAGSSTTAKVRFHWENGSCDWWWAIDNVTIQNVTCFYPSNLMASNVTSTGAELTWTAPASAPANGYEYYYSTSSTAPSAATIPSGSTVDTFASASTLTSNTQYYFWVRSVCSATDTSDWSPSAATFTTQPAAQIPATLPYTDDFTATGGNWTILNGAETNQWYVGSAAGNPGNGLFISDDNGTTNEYNKNSASVVQAYRDITFPSGATFNLKFDWQNDGEDGWDYIRVWLVPNSFVPTPGTQITASASGGIQLGGNMSGSDDWDTAQYTIPATFAGTTSRLIFEWRNDGGGGTQPPAAIDNISVTEIACSTPLNITVSSITATGATLSWDSIPSAPANGYQYYYSTSNTTPSITTVPSGTSMDTFASVSGLAAYTQYHCWVRAVCSATDTSDWSASATFTTLPAAQTPATLPYSDNFTSTGGNWTILNGTETNQWYIGSAAGNPGNGLFISDDNGTTYEYDNSSTSVVQAYRDIIFPSGSNPFNLKFDWKSNGESCCDYMRVWLLPSSFVPTPGTQITASASGGLELDDKINGSSNWNTAQYIIPDSFAGTTSRLVFEWKNDGSQGPQPPAAVDNINIHEITCSTPVNAIVSSITATGATLSWDSLASAPANGYQYYYSTSSTAPAASTPASGAATDTFAILTSLAGNTQYYCWVRALCSATDTSDWSAMPAVFTTLPAVQIPATLPYTDNFTATGGNWTILNGTETNQWHVGSAAGNPGNGLFISDDNGTTYEYDKNSASVVQAYRDITFPSGNNTFDLKFDWQNEGEDGWDYVRVWVVPDTFIPTPGTQITASASGGIQMGGSMSSSDGWDTAQFIIPATFAGTTSRLVFEWRNDGGGGTQPPAAIDNINVTEIICSTPVNLAVTNVTATNAVITWDSLSTAPANGFQYYYNTSNIAPTAATTASGSAADTFASLSGLTSNTQYYVWVRSLCSATDTSDWTSTAVTFTTLCNATNIPYTVPLASVTTPALPSCMTMEFINPTGYWETANNPGNGFTGKTLRTHWTSVGTGAANDWIYTRGLILTGGTSYKLHYRYGNNSSSSFEENLAVKYGNAATADSMLITLADHPNIDDGVPHDTSIIFTPATSGTYFIGFQSYSDENQFRLYLDSISITEVPPCIAPDTLTVTAVTATTADLSWNGSAANYTLEYDTAGFTLGTGNIVSVSGNTYTVSNLDPNTDYDFYVRSICIPGVDSSAYSTAEPFTTACNVVTVALGNDTSFCPGDTITLNAGNSGSSYLWSDNSTSQTLDVSAAGDYSVTVTNEYGCSGADTVTISANAVPVVDLGADTSICEGQTLTLDAANAGSTYLWNDASTAQTLDVSAAGDYSVAVTNTLGCTGSDTITVGIDTVPVVNLGADTSICEGQTLILDAANAGSTYLWSDASTNQTLDVTDSGVYSVIVTNTLGCSGADTVHIGVDPLPSASSISVTDNGDGTYTFSADDPSDVNGYNWDFGDGSPISNVQEPTHTYAPGSDTFTVTLIITNDCGSDTLTTTVAPLGIRKVNIGKEQLKLYPNPTRNIITIQNESAYKMKAVTVYNVLGQVVMQQVTTDAYKYKMDVSGLTSGLYTVRIETNAGFVMRKFEVLK